MSLTNFLHVLAAATRYIGGEMVLQEDQIAATLSTGSLSYSRMLTLLGCIAQLSALMPLQTTPRRVMECSIVQD